MESNNYKIRDEFGYYPDEDAPSRSTGSTNFANSFKKNFNAFNKIASNDNKSKILYVEGQKVKHAKFGVGTVIAVLNDKSGQKVVVKFNEAGVKTFVPSLAPMEIIN